jgi:hypothetical protein
MGKASDGEPPEAAYSTLIRAPPAQREAAEVVVAAAPDRRSSQESPNHPGTSASPVRAEAVEVPAAVAALAAGAARNCR